MMRQFVPCRAPELQFSSPMPAETLHPLEALMRERIVLLDGAMGTMVQQHKLTESGVSGARASRIGRAKRFKGEHRASASGPSRRSSVTRSTDNISRLARTSSRPTRSALRRSACTISFFAANRRMGARILNFFSAWWTSAELRDLAREINAWRRKRKQHGAGCGQSCKRNGATALCCGSARAAPGDRFALA